MRCALLRALVLLRGEALRGTIFRILDRAGLRICHERVPYVWFTLKAVDLIDLFKWTPDRGPSLMLRFTYLEDQTKPRIVLIDLYRNTAN